MVSNDKLIWTIYFELNTEKPLSNEQVDYLNKEIRNHRDSVSFLVTHCWKWYDGKVDKKNLIKPKNIKIKYFQSSNTVLRVIFKTENQNLFIVNSGVTRLIYGNGKNYVGTLENSQDINLKSNIKQLCPEVKQLGFQGNIFDRPLLPDVQHTLQFPFSYFYKYSMK